MSAIVGTSGTPRQLDKRAEPDAAPTEADVQDTNKLVRLLFGILKDVAALKRKWAPNYIDFEDLDVDATGATLYRLTHKFGGRVRFWAVDWTGASAGPALTRDALTDANTLILVSSVAGTVTIRVQEAG
jgi:hypothetical protein